MNTFVPSAMFLTKGVGTHIQKLQSFELALRDAGIEIYNLVRVSSIFPPGCRIVSRTKGVGRLCRGQVVYCVMADTSTNEPSRLIAASIGLAVPAAGEQYGYLSEHHAHGMTEEKAGDYAEDLAATMLATTLGIEFDPDRAYDERREMYRMSGKIVKARSVAQSAEGKPDGSWTTVVAAAVFVTLNVP